MHSDLIIDQAQKMRKRLQNKKVIYYIVDVVERKVFYLKKKKNNEWNEI